MPDRIKIIMEGSTPGDPVVLGDFASEISAFTKALEETDKSISGGKSVQIVVADLRRTNPTTVTLDSFRDSSALIDNSHKVFPKFISYLDSVAAGMFEGMSRAFLTAIREIASPLKRMRAIVFEHAERQVSVSIDTADAIKAYLDQTYTALGSVKGKLEQMNLHGKKQFRIYPSHKRPTFITCRISQSLVDRAAESMNRHVIVSGRLTYKQGEDFASEIDVQDIVTLPPESELPTMREVRQGLQLAPCLPNPEDDDNW